MTNAGAPEYETRIVRVFPDFADTVIWFRDPMPYDDTCLSQDLVARLTAWEAAYYAALTDDFTWRSAEERHRFSADGLELAREVASEIGPEFEVEYASFDSPRAVARLRSEQPASNTAAREAFGERAERAREDWAQHQSRTATGTTSPSVALRMRTRSGEIFVPRPPE